MKKSDRIRIAITDSMVEEALKRSEEQGSKLTDRNCNNKNEKSKHFYRDLGFLGEIVFEHYLDSFNLYYSKDEDALQEEYGLTYDLGDVFASKNGKAIDIKTTVAHHKNDRLHYSQEVQDFREIDYLVSLLAYPITLTQTLDIKGVDYIEIAGYITSGTLNNSAKPANYYAKGYYYYENEKLTNIENILSNFYTKDEFKGLTNQNELVVDNALNYLEDAYIVQQLSVDNTHQRSLEYDILTQVSDRIKESVDKVYTGTVKANRLNKAVPLRGKEDDSFYYIITTFNLMENNQCAVPILVRTLMRFGALAKKNNKRLYLNVYLDSLDLTDIINMMSITRYLPITYCVNEDFASQFMTAVMDEYLD